MTLPLVLPPVVGGVALLLAFGRTGFIGRYLDSWFGLTIPFTPIAVVMAETFVAMPFLIVTVEGALRSADQGFEEAAATLGAKRMTVFRQSRCPWSPHPWGQVQCCAGRGHWANSGDDFFCRGRFLAGRRRCPSPCTTHWRMTPTRRSR